MNQRSWLFVAVGVALCAALGLYVSWNRGGGDDFTVGVVAPLTGDNAKYGESAKRALELCADELNAASGVRGKKIRLIFEDSQGTPQKGVTAFQKLITIDRVPVVIGDLLSTSTLAIAPIAERNRVVLLSPTSSAPKITDTGDYIFRNVASDVFEGRVVADAAIDRLGVTRVAVISINNDYGAGMVEVFRKRFKERGGMIVSEETYAQNASDFRTQLTKIADAKPEVIYMVGYRELGQLLKQATDLGLEARFLSNVLFEDPEILKIAGPMAEGVIYSSRAYDSESNDPTIRKFVDGYRARYSDTPDVFAAYSYDAMRILALAVERNGVTSDDIRSGLYSIKDFQGVCGLTSFDENGDVIQPAFLKTVRNGKFVWLEDK
jgi:branched-chain amino acid transport system substrate-binding protein